MSPPEALREALGQVIADQRREWRRERELIEAQARLLEAESRQIIAELRTQIVELQAELRAKIDARLAEVKDGAQGERGPAGEIGPEGSQGVAGPLGERGPAGEQGPQGERGAAGEVGPQGEIGPSGPEGERGEPGPEGIQGERGEPGLQGERGDAGPAGERGETGDAGSIGSQGERGEPGIPGERGVEGAPGKLPAVGDWEDRVYRESDIVTSGGAIYQAQRDTGKAPPHDDWHCIVPAGRDGRSLNPCGTWGGQIEMYNRLDVVVLDGGAFVAKRDDPGPCPGEGWQLLVQRGKAGKPGDKGESIKGDKGKPGPAVVAIDIDDRGLVTLTNADGTTAQGDFYPVLSQIAR